MKKSLFSLLLLCIAIGIKAQISANGNWYNGSLVFTAKNMPGGRIVMNATAEGEEIEFALTPVQGKKDSYRVTDGPNGGFNIYEKIQTVRHRKQGGLDALCFYDSKGLLQAVMSNEREDDAVALNKSRWLSQVAGEYHGIDMDSEGILIIYGPDEKYHKGKLSINGQLVGYEIETFNGDVTGYIRINGTATMLDCAVETGSMWELVPTLDDLRLYETKANGDDTYFFDRKRNGMSFYLPWYDDEDSDGRFAYANKVLLNDKRFRSFDKPTLRIMRNSILAHHGYQFKSSDLKEYFMDKVWYAPRATNDGINEELSLIEQLNIELIKAEEENPEHDNYIKQ